MKCQGEKRGHSLPGQRGSMRPGGVPAGEGPLRDATSVVVPVSAPGTSRKGCPWIPSNFWEEAKRLLALAGPMVRAAAGQHLAFPLAEHSRAL